MAELRLGIFGGSFNPIHLGHLLLAESFREHLALDRLLFVPVGRPPHKDAGDVISALHRYAMVSLAVAGHGSFAASDVEVRRLGPSYTVETLEVVAGEWPDARLFLVMGGDTFIDLPSWRTPERLTARATLAVGHRRGSAFDPDGPGARSVLELLGRRTWQRVPPASADAIVPGEVVLVDALSLPVSAREVRRRCAVGESVRYLVPLTVAEYIAAHDLYRHQESRASDAER
jgi:nicotinate-nucleotide adenylyltransferase